MITYGRHLPPYISNEASNNVEFYLNYKNITGGFFYKTIYNIFSNIKGYLFFINKTIATIESSCNFFFNTEVGIFSNNTLLYSFLITSNTFKLENLNIIVPSHTNLTMKVLSGIIDYSNIKIILKE